MAKPTKKQERDTARLELANALRIAADTLESQPKNFESTVKTVADLTIFYADTLQASKKNKKKRKK